MGGQRCGGERESINKVRENEPSSHRLEAHKWNFKLRRGRKCGFSSQRKDTKICRLPTRNPKCLPKTCKFFPKLKSRNKKGYTFTKNGIYRTTVRSVQ